MTTAAHTDTGTLGLGYLTPPQITANQNNYSPTNGARKSIWRLSSDASRDITGIVPPSSEDRVLVLVNVGSFPIVLNDESGSSTNVNRFGLTGDLTLSPDQGIILAYDQHPTVANSRWHVLAATATFGDITTNTFLGRDTAGTGPVEVLTSAQATSNLDAFSTGTQGVAPASGGGSTNYLRADGTWAVPPGGSGAPTAAQYLTLALDASLSAERVLTAGENVSFADTGSNGTLTIAALTADTDLTGVLTPTTIAANQSDYAPTNHATNTVFRLAASTPGFDISSMAGVTSGRLRLLMNVGSFPITLRDEGAGTAAYRFSLPSGDMALAPDDCAIVMYDGTTQRWRLLGSSVVYLPVHTDALHSSGFGTPVSVGGSNSEGVATTHARSDHQHSGSGGGSVVVPIGINYAGGVSWTPGASGQELSNNSNRRSYYDLTSMTQARILCTMGTASPASGILVAQYSTDQSTWNNLCTGTNVPQCAADSATGVNLGSFATIAGGALGAVYLRVIYVGTSGTLLAYGHVEIQVKP